MVKILRRCWKRIYDHATWSILVEINLSSLVVRPHLEIASAIIGRRCSAHLWPSTIHALAISNEIIDTSLEGKITAVDTRIANAIASLQTFCRNNGSSIVVVAMFRLAKEDAPMNGIASWCWNISSPWPKLSLDFTSKTFESARSWLESFENSLQKEVWILPSIIWKRLVDCVIANQNTHWTVS